MKITEIRVPYEAAKEIKQGLESINGHESAIFALITHAKLKNKDLILVRAVRQLNEQDYIQDPGHGAKWSGKAMMPIINEAMAGEYGILLIHSHLIDPAGLSGDDRSSAEELLPFFQRMIPTRPHGSIVLGATTASGLILMPTAKNFNTKVKLRWLEPIIVDQTHKPPVQNRSQSENDRHFSQNLLMGSAGHNRLKQAKIAVVGLSGGGSHVVQQLAHIGIGEIIGIDSDHVEKRNHARLIGITDDAVLRKEKKTVAMAELVKRIDKHVKFTGIPYDVPRQQAMDALKEADIIVGCVDSLHSKKEVQELAWRYLIPYIDIGVLIRPMTAEGNISIGGNVITCLPGKFCLWCVGHITQQGLDNETGGRPKSYFKGTGKQAQVISFNGIVASQAVSEVLQLLTGFAPAEEDMVIKKFDGLNGTLANWRVSKNYSCSLCKYGLALGDSVWKKV
jgi:molybdopterin-synthase adenylyltransferase